MLTKLWTRASPYIFLGPHRHIDLVLLHVARNCEKMSAPKKKHAPNVEGDEDVGSSDSEYSMDEEETFVPMEQLNFTFEGFTPEDVDFHAIRGMLEKVFVDSEIDLSALADFVISHGHVTTVLKQDYDDDEEVPNEDSDDEPPPALGLITVFNLTAHKETPVLAQLRAYLLSKAKRHAPESLAALSAALDGGCGLVISVQQIVHPQIASCMWSALSSDVVEADRKQMPYKFNHVLVLSRTAEPVQQDETELMYCQPEEQCFKEIAKSLISWPAPGQNLVDGKWTDEDHQYKPMRTLSHLTGFDITALSQSVLACVTSTR